MTGAFWAVLSGIGFGVFQTFNRRAVQGMDVFMATFLQLIVSAIVLFLATLLTLGIGSFADLTPIAILHFSLAGALHFFFGWTFLNASQKAIGAARTTSLIGTTPIFAAIFAAFTLAELPTLYSAFGIFVIIVGVYLVNASRIRADSSVVKLSVAEPPAREPVVRAAGRKAMAVSSIALEGKATGLRSLRFGIAAAVCWSLSPTFIRFGLAELSEPVLGVTVGMVASAIGFAVVLAIRGSRGSIGPVEMDATGYKLLAAVLVALATWSRWTALELAPVAAVLALSLLSVPIVNFLSPLVSGRELENVTPQVWLGSGLIILGSLILIFAP